MFVVNLLIDRPVFIALVTLRIKLIKVSSKNTMLNVFMYAKDDNVDKIQYNVYFVAWLSPRLPSYHEFGLMQSSAWPRTWHTHTSNCIHIRRKFDTEVTCFYYFLHCLKDPAVDLKPRTWRRSRPSGRYNRAGGLFREILAVRETFEILITGL